MYFCYSQDYIVLPPKRNSRCPLSIEVAKDECEAAGLAVGGVLQDDETVVEGSWNNRPSGCFFGPKIHYNTNGDGVNDNSDTYSPWHPICNKMKVRFLMLSLLIFKQQLALTL